MALRIKLSVVMLQFIVHHQLKIDNSYSSDNYGGDSDDAGTGSNDKMSVSYHPSDDTLPTTSEGSVMVKKKKKVRMVYLHLVMKIWVHHHVNQLPNQKKRNLRK